MGPQRSYISGLISSFLWSTRFSTSQFMYLTNGCERSGPSSILSRWWFYRKTLSWTQDGKMLPEINSKNNPKCDRLYISSDCISVPSSRSISKLHLMALPLDLFQSTFISDLNKATDSILVTCMEDTNLGRDDGLNQWYTCTLTLLFYTHGRHPWATESFFLSWSTDQGWSMKWNPYAVLWQTMTRLN